WHHPRRGRTTTYSGKWTAKREKKGGMHVHFAYPSTSNEADVVVSGKSMQLVFSNDYPVCVYQRIGKK
ncbi:MAG: hypothetical protein AAF989_08405, partial [Planctomycetota bacterium]